MAKYLDENGLLYFWQKIKEKFSVIGHKHSGEDITSGTIPSARLPIATANAVGGIKIGERLTITNGVLSADEQTTISGNAETATNLKTKRTIDGVEFDGSAAIHHYGTCTTEAGTAAKVATLSTPGGNFKLVAGALCYIKMSNANGVANATLNVNSTGAKNIYRYGTTAPGTNAKTSWQAGEIVCFLYDGASWLIVGWLNDDTTYANMKAATADAAGTAGLVPAPAAGKQGSFLRGDGTWATPANTDTKVNVTLGTTSKAYLLGVTTTPTATAQALTTISDTGVYLDTTAGKLTATSVSATFSGNGSNITNINGSNIASGTVAAARLPVVSTTANGIMTKEDKSKLDAFGAASDYALKTDITALYKHKGSVAAVANLPTTGNTTGDVYNVTATGMNYVWDGSAWDALGEIFTINSITNSEIDTVVAS